MNSDKAVNWLHQASRYFKAAELLHEANDDEYFLYPCLTLLSFSIECSLKCIAHRIFNKANGKHDLLYLFENIPQGIKKSIIDEYKDYSGGKQLINDLQLIKKYFLDSRYEVVGMNTNKNCETLYSGACFLLAEFLITYITSNEQYINKHIQELQKLKNAEN